MRIFTVLIAMFIVAPDAAAQPKIPVVIDTDIGADIDDAFAIGFALASPELDIRGITTVGRGGPPDPFVQYVSKERDEDRAWMVGRFLAQSGAKPVPVAAGADPQPKSPIDWQIQYRRHPAVVYNRTIKPVKEPAVGDLVAYRSGDGIAHLGVVRYVSANRPPLVEGKWGASGVFLHQVDRSIYGREYAYLRSPRPGHLLAGIPEARTE